MLKTEALNSRATGRSRLTFLVGPRAFWPSLLKGLWVSRGQIALLKKELTPGKAQDQQLSPHPHPTPGDLRQSP